LTKPVHDVGGFARVLREPLAQRANERDAFDDERAWLIDPSSSRVRGL
jgi:hypothetical protein